MDGPIIEVIQQRRQPIFLVVAEALEIGRECDGLLLADPEVSRRHVLLTATADGVTVEDLGSRNGTTVDGRPVTGPTPLGRGQSARVGTTEITLVGRVGESAARSTAHLAPSAGRGTMASPSESASPSIDGPEVVMRGDRGNDDARMTSIEMVAGSVDSSQGVLAGIREAGDTVTIVFSDIESSTEQAMRLGDQKWFSVLGIHNDIVRSNVRAFGGSEIKSQGDGFMLTFPSARKAVQCCIKVQRDLARHAEREPETGVRIRIGLHTGEAIVDDDGDLFGKHIIVAARIANLADGGQILASGIVRDITSSRGDIEFGPAQSVDLKGIDGAYAVHNVTWQE